MARLCRALAVTSILAALSDAHPLLSSRQGPSVPQYVLDHAPLLWLDTNEHFFPSDLASQLTHSHPTVGSSAVNSPPSPLTLSNLNALNGYGTSGTNVYLTSNEGIKALPPWFNGVRPSSDGSTPSTTGSVIITVSKPNSILDAFYFSFYAYNQGNWVFESPLLEFGDHVGDWEHTMIRFNSSTATPLAMWFSQHASGQAFEFSALEKSPASRPYVYVGRGTHANYATPGPHDHTIPGFNIPVGPLIDHTSRGTLWDPTLNSYIYSYTPSSSTFKAYNGADPTGFLSYVGRWGDPALPDSTPGQVDVFGQKKYGDGPTGPRDKNLDRQAVCPSANGCVLWPERFVT